MKRFYCILLYCFLLMSSTQAQETGRESFDRNWFFYLGNDTSSAAQWRSLHLPHDWSIELPFDEHSPTGTGGGALRGGPGWYRKQFILPETDKGRKVFIDFDGVYCRSEVFINGHSLGKRPNGYISFRYELTPYLRFGGAANTIVVKVDNSQQPNSRWYSGSGIYRHVWLVKKQPVHIVKDGVYITTAGISGNRADLQIQTDWEGAVMSGTKLQLQHTVYDQTGRMVKTIKAYVPPAEKENNQTVSVANPRRWSLEDPFCYSIKTKLLSNGKLLDEKTTVIGIRSFYFDAAKGFFLNDKPVKIIGVCNHHDLGCLGTAVNKRAIERQLEILKGMGINGIRTSHNPPAPELLDLADRMGFIVMDEAFDMWKRSKTAYDYSQEWDNWYHRDLEDFIKRDRNHPSVFMWSVGNEIGEQWGDAAKGDTAGRTIMRDLVAIVKKLDNTRPVLTANNEPGAWNNLLATGVNDIIGYNYNHLKWDSVQYQWGRKPFIVTESVSALQTRGSYDMPSDSIRRWPARWDLPVQNANADLSCSAYDNCATPWGSTHEETLKELLGYEHISGMYVWTGFDYLGEPTPYPWPARSSYFGIVDLAGFPKDVYYLYQSLFTSKNVLHVFPHWNWQPGQQVDVWAYYNNADEVELYLNGQSLGKKSKTSDELHVQWRVSYEPGILKAVSRKNGKQVLEKEIHTAGSSYSIRLTPDRSRLSANGDDLSFITVEIVDKKGNVVPDAANLVKFTLKGPASIAGVDNGSHTSMESFQASQRSAFKGKCLVVIRTGNQKGAITVTASADGLLSSAVSLQVQ
ncbi:MAG: glycoside hydrolase family 2 TIM barrel-domain containing protein [Chitinophagaceae bacterium]